MNIQYKLLPIIGILALSPNYSAFADSDHEREDDRVKSSKHKNEPRAGFSAVKRMAKAMGGLDKILDLEGTGFFVSGTRFEPEQTRVPNGQPIKLVEYNYRLINDLTEQRSFSERMNNITFAFLGQRQFSEVINGDHGAVFGFDTIIAPPQAPMLSTRIGARSKQYLVSSPLALIHRASQFKRKIKLLGIKKFKDRRHQVVSIPGFDQDIKIFIDIKSKLPSKIETREDDTVYGDTKWEIILSHWQEVNGIKVPTSLTHKLNGRVINTETRSSFNLEEDLDDQIFSIPAELITELDQEQFSWGVRMSQWFSRLLPIGVPFDLDQGATNAITLEEVAPKVFHARGFTHHSMIIEMDDYIIVTEAPLYEERSILVINTIKKRWPHKPIKYLVVSHFHNDHIGGIRAYGAIGATIIIGDKTEDHFEDIFEAKHTVQTDSYALNPIDIEYKIVKTSKDLVLTDGKRKVRIFDVPNRHSIGFIVPLVEDAGLIFVSDLYNPDLFPTDIPQDFLGWAEDLLANLKPNTRNVALIIGGHGGVGSYEDFVTQVEASLQ